MTNLVLQQSHAGGVITLELNHSPVNALSQNVVSDLRSKLHAAHDDPSNRAIIITGAGKAFCGGADLRETPSEGAPSLSPASLLNFLSELSASRLPTIAAVNGACVGAGLELALCCDIRLAASDAVFQCAGVNVGLILSAYRLPGVIGLGRAKEMLLTGLPYSADVAESWGLVTGVHARSDLSEHAMRLARRLAGRARLSVEATKRVANGSQHLSEDDGRRFEHQELATLLKSDDHHQAMRAFRKGRPPEFNPGQEAP